MTRVSLACLGVLTLALPSISSAQASPSERAAVQRVIVSYAENVQSGAFAAVEALFTPEPHILTGNSALHAFAEYLEPLRAELARYPGLRYTHTGIETFVRGDVAWSNFRWQMSGGSGAPAPVLGRGTMILEKVGDKWLIAQVHFSR